MKESSQKESEKEQQPNPPYGKITIYALADPQTHRIFYVGQTKRQAKGRLQAHIREAQKYKEYIETPVDPFHGIDLMAVRAEMNEVKIKGKKYNVRKCRWILSILERELYPELKILDEWEAPVKQDAHRLEEAWIAQMRMLGMPITNFIYSHRMSPEWYSKANKSWKEGYAQSPTEYIQMLKDGEVGGYEKKTRKASKRYTRYQMSRYSKRSRNAQKKNRRSGKRKRKR